MKVSVVNMAAQLGELSQNLKIAENYIREAKDVNSEIIVFPEFFTTGFALNSDLLAGISRNGQVEQWMQQKSRRYQIAIGGSFLQMDLATSNVYNTYALYFPSGESYFHRKDIPTMIENFCYDSGDEISAFPTPLGRIGIVMCWEQLRWQTVKRMKDKVDFLIGGSCWWNLAPEDDAILYDKLHTLNRDLARNAPINFAKIMGVPFVHATVSGTYVGGAFTNPDIVCRRRIESNAVIVDANGKLITSDEDKMGVFHGVIQPQTRVKEIVIPENSYWIPDMPELMNRGFFQLNNQYHQYYEKHNPCKTNV